MELTQASEYKNLGEMMPGENGYVRAINSDNQELRVKLLSLGLVKDTLVKIKNAAPLGDPITISLRGIMISLRRSEANVVSIEKR